MQSLQTCLTIKGGGFAHGDLEPLVNEFWTLTYDAMQSLHAGPLKGEDLHTVTLRPLVNEPLVNEVWTSHVMPCNHYMLDL